MSNTLNEAAAQLRALEDAAAAARGRHIAAQQDAEAASLAEQLAQDAIRALGVIVTASMRGRPPNDPDVLAAKQEALLSLARAGRGTKAGQRPPEDPIAELVGHVLAEHARRTGAAAASFELAEAGADEVVFADQKTGLRFRVSAATLFDAKVAALRAKMDEVGKGQG